MLVIISIIIRYIGFVRQSHDTRSLRSACSYYLSLRSFSSFSVKWLQLEEQAPGAKDFLELYKLGSISPWNLAAASTVCNFPLCPDVLKNVSSGKGWKILAVVIAVDIGCPTRTARLALQTGSRADEPGHACFWTSIIRSHLQHVHNK